MAYTPTNWKDGDIISAEKMNKLEQGVAEGGGGGVLLVNVTKGSDGGGGGTVVNSASPMLNAVPDSPTFTADKTYAEIKTAIDDDQTVIVKYQLEHIGTTPITETAYLTLKCTTLFLGDKIFIFGSDTGAKWCRIQISPQSVIVYESLNTIQTNISSAADGTSYSKVDTTYDNIIFNSNFDIKLLVIDHDKTMIYTMNEYYPNDHVIAFSGADKVVPLYMDNDGNISKTYPTSGETQDPEK